MDNNNFNQPMPGQPNPVNQPMPNQPVPPYGQPYPPYQQPMPRPPKQPMDPAKKKKLILGLSIGGVVLALGITAAIVIPILLRVDYGPAYATAKELKPKIYDIYHSYDCEYVVDNVDSTYTTPKQYAEYIEGCKDVYSSNADELVAKLGDTAGVKRDSKIGTQYEKFKSEYTKLSSGDSESLDAKLKLWQARHDFKYAEKDLDYSSSDSEWKTAYNYLINSGNDTLKTYGENLLQQTLEITAAYRAYRAASWQESSQLLKEYNNKKSEHSDWIAANKPDINDVAPLNFNDTSKMYSEFSTLYDLISQTYALNYNFGSGDCTEFMNMVNCD